MFVIFGFTEGFKREVSLLDGDMSPMFGTTIHLIGVVQELGDKSRVTGDMSPACMDSFMARVNDD